MTLYSLDAVAPSILIGVRFCETLESSELRIWKKGEQSVRVWKGLYSFGLGGQDGQYYYLIFFGAERVMSIGHLE